MDVSRTIDIFFVKMKNLSRIKEDKFDDNDSTQDDGLSYHLYRRCIIRAKD